MNNQMQRQYDKILDFFKKEDEKTRVVVAFSNKGNGMLLQEDGILATFSLVAKGDGVVDLSGVSTLLVGPNLKH